MLTASISLNRSLNLAAPLAQRYPFWDLHAWRSFLGLSSTSWWVILMKVVNHICPASKDLITSFPEIMCEVRETSISWLKSGGVEQSFQHSRVFCYFLLLFCYFLPLKRKYYFISQIKYLREKRIFLNLVFPSYEVFDLGKVISLF